MTDETDPQPEPEPDPEREKPASGTAPQTQEVRHSHVSALVPEQVARGVFSTGAVVLQGGHEFIVDFLLRMTSPHQVAARVIFPPSVIPRFIAALRENLTNYQKRFGVLPPPQKPNPGTPQPSAQEVYDQLKIADETLSGKYANAVMIGHTATEFSFDFITTFFPRSAVSSRVYLSAPNVPRLLDSLTHAYEQFQTRVRQQQELQQQKQAEAQPAPEQSADE